MSLTHLRRAALPALIVAFAAFTASPASAATTNKSTKTHKVKTSKPKTQQPVVHQTAPQPRVNDLPPDRVKQGEGY
jgi:hypothetical protein